MAAVISVAAGISVDERGENASRERMS